jgi:NAD-dependent DNA ligase
MKTQAELVHFGRERISDRQIDELIGICRGLTADSVLNQSEVEFLQKWLAANRGVSDHPVIATLYHRVADVLEDGILDEDEAHELLETLSALSNRDFELGEVLRSTTLPLCSPAPSLWFPTKVYTFTGTFNYGNRKACEAAVEKRGASVASLTRKTDVLVVGVYATESWKHSSFGRKIEKASDYRSRGVPISIVSEEHWLSFL